MKETVFAALLLLLSSCSAEHNLVEDAFNFADIQLKTAIRCTDSVRTAFPEKSLVSPRTIDGENLMLVPSRDWTSGFFPGELWYMYEYTGDEYWKSQAMRYTSLLEDQQFNAGTHDMGFKMFCSYGNGYRITRDTTYRNILLQSAETLSGRFNPVVGCIRSWDFNRDKWDFPVIIDNMMNLELLYWAARESGDTTYSHIATTHAMTTMKNHFRPDNSSYHVVDYDPNTGEVRLKQTHQGYNDESSWTRGQAWGLYGYVMCYRETGIEDFLRMAIRIEEYMSSSNTAEDGIFYWDLKAPGIPDEPRDASAAAIYASALYELARFVPENSQRYISTADRVLNSLYEYYRSAPGADYGFLLLHSTGSKTSEIDVPLIYADYYFLEALLRKDRTEELGRHQDE